MNIETKQLETDKQNYLQDIVNRLNSRWNGLEDMESRLELYLVDIAQELGGIVDFQGDTAVFDFIREV